MINLVPISLIIPTFNRPVSLIRTLISLQDKSFQPNEIIIIDQSNSFNLDNNFLLIHNIHLKIRIIKNPKISISESRNIGLRESNNEYIVFSDDDVDFLNEVFQIIIDNFSQDKNLNMIAAYDVDHKFKITSLIGIFTFRKSLFKLFVGHVSKSILGNFPILKIRTTTEWAMGFFFSFRKSICTKYNIYFDESFSTYSFSEDLDFSYRYIRKIKEFNLIALILPEIKVKHLVSSEFRIKTIDFYLMYLKNRYYLIKKLFNSSSINKFFFNLSNFFFYLFLLSKSKNESKKFLIAKKEFLKSIKTESLL